MAQPFTDTALQLISDANANLQQRVLGVLRFATHWATSATRAEKQAVLAPAVSVLADILRDSWPAGAVFADSDATSDRVLALDPALDPPVLAWGPCGQRYACLTGTATTLLRSLRRVAGDALAVLIQDTTGGDTQLVQDITQQLVAAGFFDVELFPSMLCAVMNRFWPPATPQDTFVAAACGDQAQGLALSLMRITIMACQADVEVARLVLREAAVGVFMAYQDPWQVKWEPQATANRRRMCTEAAARQTSHLSDEQLLRAAQTRRDLRPPGMSQQQAEQEAQRLLVDTAGMPQLVATLAGAIISTRVITGADGQYVVALSDAAEADCKLDRLLHGPVLVRAEVRTRLETAADILKFIWHKRANKLSLESQAKREAGPVARADALRQSGNTAFKAGQLQAALADYKAALLHTPDDSRLYSNVAVVQLRLGAVNEAVNAAMSALGHDATNVRAWARLGEAFSEVGRWQLAQLSYQAALQLQADPAVQELRAAVLPHLTAVWSWDEVPPSWRPAAVARWLGSRAVAQQDPSDRMLESVTNSSPYAHLSRYIAVQLKQLQLTADAVVQARQGAMLRLPAKHGWQCGYSDTPCTGTCTGTVKHMLSIADAETSTASSPSISPLFVVEGRPSANDMLQALAMTCLQRAVGSSGQAYKPRTLLLPFRMMYMFAELKAALTEWGVPAVEIETQAESQRASKQFGTDWRGLNYVNQYIPERLFDFKGCRQKDKGNDQRPGAPSSRSSAGGSRGQASSSGGGSGGAATEDSPPAAPEHAPAGSSSGGGQGVTAGSSSSSAGGAQPQWECVLERLRGGAATEADLVWLRQQASRC